MVYALVVDRITADVRAIQQAALLSAVMGGKPEWPDIDERIAEADAALAAPPVLRDQADLELYAALGLRGTGG